MEPLRLDLARIAPLAAPSVSESSRVEENSGGTMPFSEVLAQSMKRVNDVQQGADKMVQKLALGEVDDVSEVSIAVEKADLALRTMMEIRNKLVDAYQQLARMSV
jgi:flagellar hook-basal body complex protein FliE